MGKLFLVSIGPGSIDLIVPRAKSAIENSEVIVGHQRYLDLIKPLLNNQTLIARDWGSEIERVDLAIQETLEDRVVSLISSGDIGIYGLGGLALERLENLTEEIQWELIPGITSANACASLLGAPLALDFLVLSLSDLMVPRETILKRAEHAGMGDFVSVLYNVQSKNRKNLIYEVLEKFKPYRSPDTPCGVVRNAYRSDENHQIVKFEDLFSMEFDMLTTLTIGNGSTYNKQNRMITRRGYTEKNGQGE